MTATEELRHLLDERGVEWWEATPCKTKWNSPIIGGPVAARVWNGKMVLDVGYVNVTPEQAIAATLGETPTPPPPTPPKQPPYDELIESLRRDWGIDVSWDGLRRFWYVGLNEKGMRMRDERDATLGRGTCKVERSADGYGWHCECGNFFPPSVPPRKFCPNCGRRVVGA